jgi:hypothetical protein
VTLGVDVIFMNTRPVWNREQLLFRLAVGALAVSGLVALRLLRWWLSWRQEIADGVPSTGRMRRFAAYGAAIAVGIGVACWRAEQKRAERIAAMARAMEAMPKTVEADVSLADLERSMKTAPVFLYIGSDEEKHHFLDESQPQTIRLFRLGRKEWEPPKVLDLDDELDVPVVFRDGKLTCLHPEKPREVDPDPGIGDDH